MSTWLRNKAIMQELLAGASLQDCAEKYNLTTSAISGCLRAVTETLQEHTDIDIKPSSSPTYLLAHKETILKHLQSPIPTTTVAPFSKQCLRKHFGKYWASKAAEVAEAWETVKEDLNGLRYWHEITSVQHWLASEGHLVNQHVTEEMQAVAFRNMEEALQGRQAEQGDVRFKVLGTNYAEDALLITAELAKGKHVVEKRFKVELIAS